MLTLTMMMFEGLEITDLESDVDNWGYFSC